MLINEHCDCDCDSSYLISFRLLTGFPQYSSETSDIQSLCDSSCTSFPLLPSSLSPLINSGWYEAICIHLPLPILLNALVESQPLSACTAGNTTDMSSPSSSATTSFLFGHTSFKIQLVSLKRKIICGSHGCNIRVSTP